MTTPGAEIQYRQEHESRMAGKAYAVFNPNDESVEDLPVIYGFNNGDCAFGVYASLLAGDGTDLGSHACSHESYIPNDLGLLEGTRPDRHETFKLHYPDGYRMEFVGYDAVRGCEGLMAAIELNQREESEG